MLIKELFTPMNGRFKWLYFFFLNVRVDFFFTGLPNGFCGREKKSSWIIIRNDIRY